jgi:hypothetical protein
MKPMKDPRDNVWWKLVNLEPATLRGILLAVVTLLAAIGIKIAPNIPDSIIAVLVVILPVIQALWTRGSVTANAKVAVVVPDPINDPGTVKSGDAVVLDSTPAATIEDAAKGGPA